MEGRTLTDDRLPAGRFTIGLATVVMLVLLRLNIGWHFFSEGAKHVTDPNWTSEGFLRQAKGPLAPKFQAVLPDHYQFEQIVHGPADQTDEKTAGRAWIDRVKETWTKYADDFKSHYKLDDEHKVRVDRALARRTTMLDEWLAGHKDELVEHVHEWQRAEKARREPSADDVPYQKKRIADEQAKRKAEAASWIAQIRGIHREFERELGDVLDQDQRLTGPVPRERGQLERIDLAMGYGILGIGVALIVGLFTRLACLLGAAFLVSVVFTQPFWVSDATPTFNQFVEMFALLTLATTRVGRWGGLDFIIHALVSSCCGRGKSNA